MITIPLIGRRALIVVCIGIAVMLSGCGSSTEVAASGDRIAAPAQLATPEPSGVESSTSSDGGFVADLADALGGAAEAGSVDQASPQTPVAEAAVATETQETEAQEAEAQNAGQSSADDERPVDAVTEAEPGPTTTGEPATTATATPTPTAAPNPTATPTAAPQQSVPPPVEPTPTPTPTATATPPPTATPTPSTVKSASPDRDSRERPQSVSVRGRSIMYDDAVSTGEDEADYYEFVFDGPPVESIQIEVLCTDVETVGGGGLNSGGRLVAKYIGEQGAPSEFTCAAQAGTSGTLAIPLGQSVFTIEIFASKPAPNFDVYAAYQLTVTPTFAEPFSYDRAPEDGDSAQAPVTDKQPQWLSGRVSAPEGDRTDWAVVVVSGDHPDGAVVERVGLLCTDSQFADGSSAAVATLFDETGTAIAQHRCTAAELQITGEVKLIAGEKYLLQVEFVGTGSTSWQWGG
jgi:hypothetical protein